MVSKKERIEFGKRLVAARTKKGVSQASLCETLGFKSPTSILNYERGACFPTDDNLKKIADILEVTTDYLLKGMEDTMDDESIKPSTKFDYKKTEEGYKDPTASAALDNVWFSGKTADVGDLADDKYGNLYLIIKKIDNNTAVMADVQTTPITNHVNFVSLKQGDITYYVNMNSFGTKSRFLKDYRKKFRVSELSFQAVKGKFNKMLGVDPILVNIVEESSKDEISEVFADSLNFYNKKNGTTFSCSKKVSLQEAYNISQTSGISLDDLCKDHEKEKAKEEIDQLLKRVEELKKKYQIA